MKIDKIESQNFGKAVRITKANRHTACYELLVNECKYFKDPRNSVVKSFINKLEIGLDYFSSFFKRKEKLTIDLEKIADEIYYQQETEEMFEYANRSSLRRESVDNVLKVKE